MSTPITTYGVDAVPDTAIKPAGAFRRALDRLIAAREAQGRRRAYEYMSSLSDVRLAELGYAPAEIRFIREKHQLPVVRSHAI